MPSTTTGIAATTTVNAEAAFGEALAVIKGTAENDAKLPTAVNQQAIGIAFTKGDPAEPKFAKATIVAYGPAIATVGAAVTKWQRLKIAGASGKLIAIGGEGIGAAVEVVAVALDSAAADGDKIGVFVNPYHTQSEA